VQLGGRLRRTLPVMTGSPALRATLTLGLGGVGFALAMLLLARVLTAADFGVVSLFLALNQVGMSFGPLGLETIIVRHAMEARPRLVVRGAATGLGVGLGVATFAVIVYRLEATVAACLAASIAAGSATRVSAALDQLRLEFRRSLFAMQVHNYVLLGIVPVLVALDALRPTPVVAIVTAGYVATAIVGWLRSATATHGPPRPSENRRDAMRDSRASVGLALSSQLMSQLERLIIPRALSMDALGSYSTLAAVAASPFRMLSIGAGYTLLPRLRASTDSNSAGRLLVREAIVIGIATTISSAAVLLATPWLLRHVLHGKYELSYGLLLAITVIGCVRVWERLAAAVITALGSSRDLASLTAIGWCAIGVGTAAAWILRSQGLLGVVLGTGLGWLCAALAVTWLAARAFQSWTGFSPAADSTRRTD
jgi:O-antigen/teichoic acid export membrane protein